MGRPALRPAHARHLGRRFVGSLRPGGPAPADEAWVAGVLSPAELGLWRRMSGADRRHAVGVARRVHSQLGLAFDPAVLAAALLHDVGKVESGLGTLGRAVATLAGMAGRCRLTPGITAYLDHSRIGAQLLAEAASDPLVVAWAAQHHHQPGRWTVPLELGHLLKNADDG